MSTYTQPNCTHDPEDFSQKSINGGQRKINYKLTVVDKKLIEALKAVVGALAKLPNPPQSEITAASIAIKEAEDVNKIVAEIRPPGCDEY